MTYQKLNWYEYYDEYDNSCYEAYNTVYAENFRYVLTLCLREGRVKWTNIVSDVALCPEQLFFDTIDEAQAWAEQSNLDSWVYATQERKRERDPDKLVIRVDIDGTITQEVFNEDGSKDYTKSIPLMDRIEHINSLYDEGHHIIYWTARGAKSGKDWYSVTEEQLKKWGCKFDGLEVGNKPHYDLYIDDKSINTHTYFQYRHLIDNADPRP